LIGIADIFHTIYSLDEACLDVWLFDADLDAIFIQYLHYS
jgi:hypothetical protein